MYYLWHGKCVINGICYLKHEPRVIPWRDYITKTWGGSNPKTNSVRLLLPGNKITSWTHTRRQIVHRVDVTLSQYSSGQNLKDTWMFYYFTCMCKSVQIFGWNYAVKGGDTSLSVPPGIQFVKKVRCVIAKTKPQYQSDIKKRIDNRCLLWKKSGFSSLREALNQLFIFRITHRDNFIFTFLRKKHSLSSLLRYLMALAGGVMGE